MDKLRDRANRLMHPPLRVLVAFVVATAALLAAVFGTGSDLAWWAYPVYLFSAYTLTVVIVAAVPPIRRLWQRLAAHPRVEPFVQSATMRAGTSGVLSALFDIAYAVFVIVTGFRYDSGWAVSVALYYFVIAAMGVALASGLVRGRKLAASDKQARELAMARTCGVLLAFMAFTLSAVMVQMVVNRQAWVYSDIVVITNATFTFINLALAIRSAVKMRAADRPAIVSSRCMSLSKTLVSLFFLETTMIAVYGADQEDFRFAMEAVTGGVVFLLVAGIAVGLIVYAVRGMRINNLRERG